MFCSLLANCCKYCIFWCIKVQFSACESSYDTAHGYMDWCPVREYIQIAKQIGRKSMNRDYATCITLTEAVPSAISSIISQSVRAAQL
jgi:hypothetical protein